jgi:8-oxo-dGTP diphosphatase
MLYAYKAETMATRRLAHKPKKKHTKKQPKKARTPPRPEDAASEQEFFARYDASAYERPSVAVDVVVLTVDDGALRAVLYRRAQHPRRGSYALPGGFVRMDESLESAAERLLRDKAGLREVFTEQLYTFGAPGRDPRARVITVAHFALVSSERLTDIAASAPGATVARLAVDWPGETGGPVHALDDDGAQLPLFLDHGDVLGVAVKRLRGKLDYTPVGFQLLPPTFSLRALQRVHEAIRGGPVNKDSFRRRMLASGHLEATGERERDVAYRPAELYRFIRRSAV